MGYVLWILSYQNWLMSPQVEAQDRPVTADRG
jgi:hypothetical protein